MLVGLLSVQILGNLTLNSHTKLHCILAVISYILLFQNHMITMPSPILILLLCLCVHACNARHLGITDKKTSRVHLLNKDVEKAKLHKILTPSRLIIRPSIQTGENFIAKHDERKPYNSLGGANTSMKHKDLKTLWKEDTTEATSVTDRAGTEILAPSLLEGSQQATRVVGWKRQARSMLASTQQHDDTKETVNSEENDVAEDIVVMDYAQPHRKPPIHNKEP